MKNFLSLIFILLTTGLQAQSFLESDALKFRHIGPERGGRSTAIEGVVKEPNVFYAGYTGGGLWKTTDYGINWTCISDGEFASPSIGSIDVYQNDPRTLYVGTGTDGLRSNLIEGRGVYKSTDAGKSWEHVGLEKTGQIGAVEIHPNDVNTVFVAAIGNAFKNNPERGIFRTKDGGKTWEKVLFISEATGFADLEFHPTNFNIIYAAAWHAERKPWTIKSGGVENGIYRSMDGGDSWEKIDEGLPELKGKIDLAVSASAPDKLYALVEAPRKSDGLYLSENKGDSFKQVSDKFELLNRPFYYTNLHADPQNSDRLWVLATRAFSSDDGGKSWKPFNSRHGDHHDIWIHPNNSDLMIEANDGGVNISFNGGKSWTNQFNQPTSEIYQVEVDNQYPYWLYGGQQDNSSAIAVPTIPPRSMQLGHHAFFMDVGGCETGPAVPHPENPDIVYSNCKGRFTRYNKASGQELHYNVGAYSMYGHNPKDLPFRFQRVAPIHISPHNPKVVYHCSQFVHKTTDEGKSWEIISPDLTAFPEHGQVRSGTPITNDITGEEFYSTIYAIQESKREKGVIWVGSNDGPVHVTKDGGKNWMNVTPQDLEPGGRVDAVEPSVHQDGKAFVCILRYQLGDPKPYIFKTTDYGASWKLVTKGLPDDFPVRVLREDPLREGLLFAGTEYGLFISRDDGEHWEAFQKNLPVTPITDIKIHRDDLVMSTMGRGFWVLDDIQSLRSEGVVQPGNQIFDPGSQIVYFYSSRKRSDAIYGHVDYPSPGINIDYTLAKDHEMVYLEILNEKDKIVRKLKSTAAKTEEKKTEDEVTDMDTQFKEYEESRGLYANKGGHRFRWNFRKDGRILAKPGKYSVRIFNEDFEMQKEFEILQDPRSIADGIKNKDINDQEKFLNELAKFKKDVDDHVKAVEKRIKELEKKEKKKAKDEEEIVEWKEYLKLYQNERPAHYPQQMFQSQVNYLLGLNNRTYQRVNKDSKERLKQLKKQYKEMKKKV